MPNTPNTQNRSAPKPTTAQITYLRKLAAQTGMTFAYPRTVAEASREIGRLKNAAHRSDRSLEQDWARRELRDVRTCLHELPGQHAPVRDDEVSGFGSTCTWA
jgi:hypothetical protein